MDDVHLSTARHFRYELRLGGKFSAAIWSAGGVPRITTQSSKLTISRMQAFVARATAFKTPLAHT